MVYEAATENLSPEEIVRLHKEEAKRIDPRTAEVTKFCVEVTDPYGVYGADHCFGRLLFVRNPEGRYWVEVGDLPAGVWDEIKARLDAEKPARSSWDDELPF